MTDLEKETVSAQVSRKSRGTPSAAPWLIGALSLGLAAGLGMGWLGHELQLNEARKKADAAAKGRGDEATGPCRDWADSICKRMGELAYECTHARAATRLLSGSACAQAQKSVLTKVETLKAERAQCGELTSKLCADLGPEGKGCELVKAKEPTFSLEDCQDMTSKYQGVLAQVMERQETGTLPNPPRQARNVTITKPN